MKKTTLFIIIFSLTLPCFISAEEISLSLDEAITIALRDNRDILLKEEEVKKAKAKIEESKSELFPSLDFTGSRTRSYELYPKDINQTTTQTTLKQYLYKGGSIINTIKYNGSNFEVAQALLDKERLDIGLNVKEAYFSLLLATELVKLNQGILDNTKEHIEVIRQRYNKGEAPESDILTIEASKDTAEKVCEESLNQKEASLALLNNLLYLNSDVKIKLSQELIYSQEEISFAEEYLRALSARPEIRQYAALQEANKKAIEIAKADTRPTIYASWDYYSRSITSLTFSPEKGWQDYYIVGFTFSWPVFDGWAAKHKVEQAIVDLKQASLRQEKAVTDIALELKNAYLDLKYALAKIKASEADVKVYRDGLLSVKDKYKQGIASLLDVSDANLKYEVAAFNKKEAIYDCIIVKARLKKATGEL